MQLTRASILLSTTHLYTYAEACVFLTFPTAAPRPKKQYSASDQKLQTLHSWYTFLVFIPHKSASYRCKNSYIMSTTIASSQNICIKLQIAPVFAFFFRKELVDWQYLHIYTPIKAELLHETWVVRKLLSQYSEHKTRGIRQT